MLLVLVTCMLLTTVKLGCYILLVLAVFPICILLTHLQRSEWFCNNKTLAAPSSVPIAPAMSCVCAVLGICQPICMNVFEEVSAQLPHMMQATKTTH